MAFWTQWTAKAKGATWSRICKLTNDSYVGVLFLISISHTRNSVCYNSLFSVTLHMSSGGKIVLLSNHTFGSNIQLRIVRPESTGTDVYVEIYDSNLSITNETEISVACSILIFKGSQSELYTTYTAGELPSGAQSCSMNVTGNDKYDLIAPKIKGDLIGNASTATTATSANEFNGYSIDQNIIYRSYPSTGSTGYNNQGSFFITISANSFFNKMLIRLADSRNGTEIATIFITQYKSGGLYINSKSNTVFMLYYNEFSGTLVLSCFNFSNVTTSTITSALQYCSCSVQTYSPNTTITFTKGRNDPSGYSYVLIPIGNHNILTSSIKASSFVKTNGTSSLFLKADGSVDSTTYATKALLDNLALNSGSGTVTSVATGVGLTGGPITATGTIKASLKSETASSLTATAMGSTTNRQYAVGVDANGHLSVNIPWIDNSDLLNGYLPLSGGTLTGHLKISGTKDLASAWDKGIIAGADGHDKVVLTYFASNTNGAVVGAHNSNLSAWALLNVAGTQIVFRNNETERMRLAANGNFGIGTSSPGYKLHVVGDCYVSGNGAIGGTIKILARPSLSTLISSYGLRSDYSSAGYPTQDYVKAWSKYAYANAAGFTALSNIDPSSRGFIFADIYASGVVDLAYKNEHPTAEIDLPMHITGRLYLHGGEVYIFGTSYGVWYWHIGITNSNITSYADSLYVKKAGDTITGNLTVQGSTTLNKYININPFDSNYGSNPVQLYWNDVKHTIVGNTKLDGTNNTAVDFLHSGNTYISNGVITINGTSITPLTSHQSLAGYLPLSGGTMTGKIIFDQTATTRDVGIIGKYDPNKAAAIWSMGSSYLIKNDGTTLGNLYGAAYVYFGNGYTFGAGYSGGHSFVWTQSGAIYAALGNYVWSRGGFIKKDSSDSYVLLGGGGHKAVSDFLPLVTHSSMSTEIPSDLVPGIHVIHRPNVEYSSVLAVKDYNGQFALLYFHPTAAYTDRILYRKGNASWYTLAYTSDLSSYLPLTGGTLSGNLEISSSGWRTFKITRTDVGWSQFGIDENGLYMYEYDNSNSSASYMYLNGGLGLTLTGHFLPNPSDTYNLGSSSKKWANVYATNFYGNLTGNATTATQASYVISPYMYTGHNTYNVEGESIDDSATSDILKRHFNGTLYPVFHKTDWGWSDTLYWSSYDKYGGTLLATEYNAINNVRIKIRKYNLSRSGWGDWTEIITTGNISNYTGIRIADAQGAGGAPITTSVNNSAVTSSYYILATTSSGSCGWYQLPSNAFYNSTYSAGTGMSLDGSTFNVKLATNTQLGITKYVKYYSSASVKRYNGDVGGSEVDTSTTANIELSYASSTSGRFYPVLVDKNGFPFVNIPWSDTTYTFTTSGSGNVLTGLSVSGTTVTFSKGSVSSGSTYSVASTSASGLTPQLSLDSTNTISSQSTDYVLTYKSGINTTPVWRKLPTNAFLNDNSWRPVYVGSTSIYSEDLILKSGTGISLLNNSGEVTISASAQFLVVSSLPSGSSVTSGVLYLVTT